MAKTEVAEDPSSCGLKQPRTNATEDRSDRVLEQSRAGAVMHRGSRSLETTIAGDSSGGEADHESGQRLERPSEGVVREGAEGRRSSSGGERRPRTRAVEERRSQAPRPE